MELVTKKRLQLFSGRTHLSLAEDIARHLDLIGGGRPEQPRVFGVGDRELDFHQQDRGAARTTALARIIEQRPGHDHVVQPRWRRLGEEPSPRPLTASLAHRYFASFRT